MEKHLRDAMAIRRFVLKTLVRLIVMIVIIAAVFMVAQTSVFTNDIAMGQMENSNDWFIAMTMYQKFANAVGWFGNLVVIGMLGWIGRDAYILAKTLTTKTENEKEN